MQLAFEELLGYTTSERMKWHRWLEKNPRALQARVQRKGRFPTVWDLMDHIYLTEARHTQRLLRESPLIEETGVKRGHLAGLMTFGYGARLKMTDYARSLSEAQTQRARDIVIRDKKYRVTPRKVLFHALLHEVRHFGQIAAAVQNAGFDPPGEHDLLFSGSVR